MCYVTDRQGSQPHTRDLPLGSAEMDEDDSEEEGDKKKLKDPLRSKQWQG